MAAVFAHATVLLAVSESIARHLVDHGAPKEKIVVHRTGIALGPPPVPRAGGREGVLFVGRFVAKKGVTDLIRAYASLPAELQRSEPLWLAGDGPLRAQVAELTDRLGVDVKLLGWQTPEDVDRLLSRAAVLCVPSRTAPDGDEEGLPTVLLEAGRHGVPVVGYRNAGIPEVVLDGESGLLVEEGDERGLAAVLEALLSDPAVAEAMGRRARQRIVDDFDIAARTRDLEAIYDDVAASTR